MVRRKSSSRSIPSSFTRSTESSRTEVLVERRYRKVDKTRALKEIKHLRTTVHLLIPKAPFIRIVRDVIYDLFPRSDVRRFANVALEALQEAAEIYIVQFFEDCYLVSQHAKRKTLMREDMFLTRRLRGRLDIINH